LAQEELAEAMTSAELVLLRGLARAHEITGGEGRGLLSTAVHANHLCVR
jgi:hypothetical protein